MTDSDSARANGNQAPASGSAGEFQVVEKTECLSLDYIQKVQQMSKTNFHWDAEYTSSAIELTA